MTLSGVAICVVGVLEELATLAANAGAVRVGREQSGQDFPVHSHFLLRGIG